MMFPRTDPRRMTGRGHAGTALAWEGQKRRDVGGPNGRGQRFVNGAAHMREAEERANSGWVSAVAEFPAAQQAATRSRAWSASARHTALSAKGLPVPPPCPTLV